jgi:L-rhamnose mutarotase
VQPEMRPNEVLQKPPVSVIILEGEALYSIYLDRKTNTLFAFQHRADDATDDALPGKEIVRKWRRMMKDVMDTNLDESPVSDDLAEMFHLDERVFKQD